MRKPRKLLTTIWCGKHRAFVGLVTFFSLPLLAESYPQIQYQTQPLKYNDYEIARSAKSGADAWTITIKKQGKVVERFKIGAILEGYSDNWAKFGLFNFLGGSKNQLIVEGYSGGAHCCSEYRIIDLFPGYRSLYDSEDWNVGYDLSPIDLDNDGVFEFTQSIMTFDYFYVSHAGSVFPTAIFKYDGRVGKYLPANRLFSGSVLKDIQKDLSAFQAVSRQLEHTAADKLLIHEDYVSAFLKVFLSQVYTGQESKAWLFFEASYKLSDKQKFRADLRKQLRGCSIYRYIYRPKR
ncbi:MAG: hypothetical protein ABI977_20350 [Acidobacteriota bacterium]